MVSLSIIIPTYNRAPSLKACLAALARQTQPSDDFEVVVVVDGSNDGTLEILAHLSTPFSLKVIFQENRGQCAALNCGVAAAQGEFCLLLDDDILSAPELVAEHLKVQRERKGVVGIGQINLSIPSDADWYTRCYQRSWIRHYSDLNQGLRGASWLDCYSGNLSLPRQAFIRAGGFTLDLSRGYDIEFAYRFQEAGWPLVYIPQAAGEQIEHKKLRQFMADTEKAGAASLEIYRRHPAALAELFRSFDDAPLRVTLARRLLLALDIPPAWLAKIGGLFSREYQENSLYYLLHRYCFWRGVRKAIPDPETWKRLKGVTPILMYHAFEKQDGAGSQYILSQRRFASQMAWLKRLGFRAIPLEEYLRCRREHRLPPARSFVITMDDGYADNRSLALPVLRRLGFPATIFLVSGHLGEQNSWDVGSPLTARPLLTQKDIREMRMDGISFGSHTRRHLPLAGLEPEQAQEEIQGSKADLEAVLGTQVSAFSYPYGKLDEQLQKGVESAGYQGACGIQPGLNDISTPLYALRRTEVYGTDSLLRFILAVWLGEDHLPARTKDKKL